MTKRTRHKYDEADLELLRYSYETNGILPDRTELSSLAMLLNVPPRNVQVWFQNQRQRSGKAPVDECVRRLAREVKRRIPTMSQSDAEAAAMCAVLRETLTTL